MNPTTTTAVLVQGTTAIVTAALVGFSGVVWLLGAIGRLFRASAGSL